MREENDHSKPMLSGFDDENIKTIHFESVQAEDFHLNIEKTCAATPRSNDIKRVREQRSKRIPTPLTIEQIVACADTHYQLSKR